MLDEKVALEIGWDCYSFGIPLIKKRFLDEEYALLFKGYQAARLRHVKISGFDRFSKKYILLRLNAWRRGRSFDSSIKPDFIRKIDVQYCPITTEKLTHSTGLTSDWSVDRINNDAGYSPGNLVIVSALANMAKDRYTYNEIRHFALDKDAILPGPVDQMRALTKPEWMRWASICSLVVINSEGRSRLEFDVVPCVARLPKNLPMNGSAGLQVAIGLFVSRISTAPLTAALAALPKKKRRELREVLSRAEKVADAGPAVHEIWFHERLFNEFSAFFLSLSESEEDAIYFALTRAFCSKESFSICVEDWAIENAGYVNKKEVSVPLADEGLIEGEMFAESVSDECFDLLAA